MPGSGGVHGLGGCLVQGGCLLREGMPGPGGLLGMGGFAWSKGVSAPGFAWSGVCLLWGVPGPRGCGIPAGTEASPLWAEFLAHTPMKILPCPKLRLRAVINFMGWPPILVKLYFDDNRIFTIEQLLLCTVLIMFR